MSESQIKEFFDKNKLLGKFLLYASLKVRSKKKSQKYVDNKCLKSLNDTISMNNDAYNQMKCLIGHNKFGSFGQFQCFYSLQILSKLVIDSHSEIINIDKRNIDLMQQESNTIVNFLKLFQLFLNNINSLNDLNKENSQFNKLYIPFLCSRELKANCEKSFPEVTALIQQKMKSISECLQCFDVNLIDSRMETRDNLLEQEYESLSHKFDKAFSMLNKWIHLNKRIWEQTMEA